MKILPAIAACLITALLAGCESDDIGEKIHSAIGPREAYRTQVFAAEQKAVYEAARAAADQMSYRIVHGGAAEGEIDALSAISPGDETGSSRQISMKVRMGPAAGPGTSVSVAFSEIIEADTENKPGVATETPMRDTPLYEVFFRSVQRALVEPPKSQ